MEFKIGEARRERLEKNIRPTFRAKFIFFVLIFWLKILVIKCFRIIVAIVCEWEYSYIKELVCGLNSFNKGVG